MLEDFRLKTFVTVARLGSFTAAARALGISQPAVSQNIAELEKFSSVRLIERSSHKLELTLKGRQLYAQAQGILDSYAKLECELHGPSSILLKDVLHDGKRCNILIDGAKFASLDAAPDTPADKVVDCSDMAILPSFYNTHTHAAMTLLRGYADDMPLQQWLTEYIWPYEDKLEPEDIKRGSELALREMVGGGTVFFSDMYFDIEQTIRVVDEMGMRAAIGITVMENHSKAETERKLDFIKNWQDPTGGRIQLVMSPHAIYTVGSDKLKKAASVARRYGLRTHIHLSETAKEVQDCYREHGMSPVKYLDSLGVLGEDLIAAHCVHTDQKDWKLLARRGVTVAHCPCSNMKLGSGRFPYELALESGCRITLGTDGASSNNSLSMIGEMKTAALLAKLGDGLSGRPELLSASEVFRWATRNGAEAFGLNAGEIAVGKLADAQLVSLSNICMQPCHNLVSNMVYSADSSVLGMLICDGRIIYKSD